MKWGDFRRSTNIEDYTDLRESVDNRPWWFQAFAEILKLATSGFAKDLGKDDIKVN